MQKTTVYLPEALDAQLTDSAALAGVSKAELIRRGIAQLLAEMPPPPAVGPLPVFRGGRRRTCEEMDQALVDQIAQRAARR